MNNFAVIEVKGNLNKGNCDTGLTKDLCTLKNFVENYEYKCGVLLIFNHSICEAKKVIQKIVTEKISEEYLKKFFLVCSKSEGKCEYENLSDIMQQK
ncbi:MAG: hypothetical protein LBQ50_06650 [Planctomycetaceae bacterium]|jgi:hypothetical protein|nr:hypothetical protein [Planctomycetaceae bacterium]